MEEKSTLNVHYGRNIKRLRDILGIKQDTIAFAMNMTQQNFSNLEQKSDIDTETLEKVAKVMKVPVEAIKNFNEDGVINIISSTLHDNSGSVIYNPTFNPIDKIVELYEKLLTDKTEQIALLKSLLEQK
ncbi:MAG: helix-turn-helix domain-containing protein [Bacteroidales bacterium]|jgi:transcriptional regulator with XRE-family HTH domain|nr:helix-turn-helix domain-containing protein [Bacteroidales bacterium]